MSEEGRTRPDSPLEVLFDSRYPTFWADELSGRRLESDLCLIQALGNFTPHDELLDLACGYGRLTNALARSGYSVAGVDFSPAMVEQARAEAAAEGLRTRFAVGDMRQPLAWAPSFDGVIVWFTSFGYFAHKVNVEVLRNIHNVLRPCGRLLMETRHWDRMARQFEPTTVRNAGDDWLIERHTYLPETGVQETHQTLLVGGERIERTSSVRRYGYPELAEMCRSVGFDNVWGFGEDGHPLTVDSTRCIVVAARSDRCA